MKYKSLFPTFQFAFLALFVCGTLFSGCKNPKPSNSPSRPNIILFMVDDMGWQDTSVPFGKSVTSQNKLYHTPNMERLAAEGVKFTQAYATPVCSPTRVSLMTGMNATNHKVTNWTLYKDEIKPAEKNHPTLDFPKWNVNGISPVATTKHAIHATTFPMIMQNEGYHTIHVGKAHLGAIGTPGEDPLNLGFEVNIAGHAAGAPQSYFGEENFGNLPEFADSPWPVPGLEEFHGQDIFLTEALTQKALKSLDQNAETGKPFFLYMSHYAVHTPIMGDPRFYQKYLEKGIDSTEAKYASMVEGMDKSLGDIMDYLEENELSENTIILFMSDNGGLSAVARGGEPHTHNLPLSSGKGSAHEGGIREPMLVKWPKVITPSSVNRSYVIIEDFFPSILEMAGIKSYETVQDIDGVSFVDMLRFPMLRIQERPLVWHFPNHWGPTGPGIGAFSSVRQGQWKYIYYHIDQREELFNIDTDIGETNNLAEERAQIKDALATLLGDYLNAVGAQMPFDKKSGEMIPYPGQ